MKFIKLYAAADEGKEVADAQAIVVPVHRIVSICPHTYAVAVEGAAPGQVWRITATDFMKLMRD